jgi:hypothetical protein
MMGMCEVYSTVGPQVTLEQERNFRLCVSMGPTENVVLCGTPFLCNKKVDIDCKEETVQPSLFVLPDL